jgi:Ser/Thr protein kinase RdoA (MazF antagonist)
MTTALTALPAATQARAAQAIAEAFPGARLESLQPLHGGLSGSPIYRLIVDERPFVLRIIVEHSLLNDPVRQLTCMRLASEQGIAPHVRYASVEHALSISAYVAHQTAVAELRRSAELVAHFGDLLRRLHSGPAFPVFLDAFQMIEGGLEQLDRRGVALPRLTQEVLAKLEPVKLALQPHLTLAPCHNDLNPANVLHDGQRLWLIDWETACMGDPMFDLAGLIHWFLLDPRQEAELLHAYFKRLPTEHELAKLTLMKHVSWWFYAIVFLLSLQDEGPGSIEAIEPEELPSFAEMLAAVGRGEIRLQDAETRQRLSLVLAKQSLDAMRRPSFGHALACLKAG